MLQAKKAKKEEPARPAAEADTEMADASVAPAEPQTSDAENPPGFTGACNEPTDAELKGIEVLDQLY
jgi:hypothetical protein